MFLEILECKTYPVVLGKMVKLRTLVVLGKFG